MLKRIKKIVIGLFVTCCLCIGGCVGYNTYKGTPKTDIKFIFVHGLSGWGSYDFINNVFPYWGLSQGSIISYLNHQGYYSYAASVNPTGSAWDRACELYAQLTGTIVDYGQEHSTRCHHERYGKDYSKNPLIDDYSNSKLVLLGHSFGGATIRIFSELLINGSEAEREATTENLSPFFQGGDKERLLALVTLAAPTNGTTAYDMYKDPTFDISSISIPEKYEKAGGMVSKGTKAKKDSRIESDYAAYDMHIDNAQQLNEWIHTFEDIYYFSIPCASNKKGSNEPDDTITETLFMRSAILMSKYTGKTEGGIEIDASWQMNDGLVNTISARAPFNATSVDYKEDMNVKPGIWYVLPTFKGDHMSLQGGMTKRVKVKELYLDLVKRISELK